MEGPGERPCPWALTRHDPGSRGIESRSGVRRSRVRRVMVGSVTPSMPVTRIVTDQLRPVGGDVGRVGEGAGFVPRQFGRKAFGGRHHSQLDSAGKERISGSVRVRSEPGSEKDRATDPDSTCGRPRSGDVDRARHAAIQALELQQDFKRDVQRAELRPIPVQGDRWWADLVLCRSCTEWRQDRGPGSARTLRTRPPEGNRIGHAQLWATRVPEAVAAPDLHA